MYKFNHKHNLFKKVAEMFIELRQCDTCNVDFIAMGQLKFFCEDCTLLRHAEDMIRLRDWTNASVKRQWNKEAKESRVRISMKYSKDNGQSLQ